MHHKPLIYLCSPYTHPNPWIMEEREIEVCNLAVQLIEKGVMVYCPIAETASLAKFGNLKETNWDYWREQDLEKLNRCDELHIAMIPGWQQSRGIRGELKFALKKGMKVAFINIDKGYTVYQEEGGCLAMFDVNSIEELND